MDFLDKRIEDYCLAYSDRESSLLKEINEYTIKNVHQPRMLSGHLQGRFLSMISKIKKPNNILEIGTYTGYSALCMADGLSKNGKLITIDKDTSLHKKVSEFFRRSKYKNQIVQKLGNAIDILPEIDDVFDLVFIDADKRNYQKYFEIVLPKVNPDGIILVDNVLWSGKVTDLRGNKDDRLTKVMDDFNKFISNLTDVNKMILPIRDGISIIIKNGQ
ncbi:MAG: methyltransferase [Flammeovirgaceae bacterium]|nr:methyltransferase [Flammeovirgaceae bacterium]